MIPPWFLHLQYLLVLLVLLLLSASWIDGYGELLPDFCFDGFSDIGYGGEFGHLTMLGDTASTNGLLRLTSGPQLKGQAYYYPALYFPNPSSVPSFSTTFVFAIISQYENWSAHGLAFVLSSTHFELSLDALPGQYLGLLNVQNNGDSSNHLLAIELDTIRNHEFNDIDDNHVGINVNSLISTASHTAGYYTSDGEFHPLRLIGKNPKQVWVDYDSKHAMLNVTLAPCCPSYKPSRPLLSVTLNLSSVLPTPTAYAGFSSATGTLNSKHYILGWSLKLDGEAAPLNYSALSIQQLDNQVDARRPGSHTTIILCVILLPTAAISMLVSAALVKVLIKRRLEARRNALEWQREYGPPSFTYKDLCAATNGFKDKMLLGRGGFGSVYKGVLPVSKHAAAIKRVSPESKQGMKEFMSEIAILGHLRHRNLVQLIGYCRHKQHLLLVYDYMPNGSLDCYLHTHQDHNTPNLCWAQRFRIIKGIASGLFYLHEDWEQVIIHRDIKTSNVLLDSEMNARLGDFGLARSHDHGADAHTTHVAGTWGYIAPELARLGKATKATDVFALGVLMMEVACARRPIWVNNANGEPTALADWVLAAWRRGSIIDAMDPRLEDHVEEEIELVLKLGLLCSHPLPNARPRMRLIIQYLERDAALPADLQPDTLLL